MLYIPLFVSIITRFITLRDIFLFRFLIICVEIARRRKKSIYIYILCVREREIKCNDASESEPHMVRHVVQITRVATVFPLSA